MNLRGLFSALLTICITSFLVHGQSTIVNRSSDPFDLRAGSTFSASSGAATRLPAVTSRTAQITSDLEEAEQIIRRSYISPVTSSDLTRDALDGMLLSLDPHSSFYDPAEWRDLLDEEQSGYCGIGASIAGFESGGKMSTYILATSSNSSAQRAGLKYGDEILAVDGVKVSGWSSDLVRDRLRGAAGSEAALTIRRAEGTVVNLTLSRGRVSQPSIEDSYMLTSEVGYVGLSNGFTNTTASEFDQALKALKLSGMHSLILDLRGNGGGIVDQAVKVAEKFLPAGTEIATQRGRSPMDQQDWRSANTAPEMMPLVVLVDQRTASASEIVTGALQDNDRALVVGDKTFGKGLVQTVISLPDAAGLTLTTARYLTPSGRSIQRDYTQMDRYDYFNHRSLPEAVGRPYFEARTVTSRRVVGGDGIQPEVPVKTRDLSDEQVKLLDEIFFFTRTAIAAGGIGDQDAASLTNAFLDSRKTPLAADLRRFSAERMSYYLMMARSGTRMAERVLIKEDEAVKAAIAALPQAADLERRAQLVRAAVQKGRSMFRRASR